MSHLDFVLEHYLKSVNKYDIWEYGEQLRTIARKNNVWDKIAPSLIEAIKTSRDHTLRSSAMLLLQSAGESARPILPYLLEITSGEHDSNLASDAGSLIKTIAGTYKDEPDAVKEILYSLQSLADDRWSTFNEKRPLLYELAQLLEAVPDFPVSREAVLKEVNLTYRAINTTLANNIKKHGQDMLPERAFEILDNLHELNQVRFAAGLLSDTIKPIEFHIETGWQDNQQISRVLTELKTANPIIKSMYVFGSRAGVRTYRRDSDLDIAVILDLENDASGRDQWVTYRDQWTAWLSERLPYEIDLNWYIDAQATPEIHRGIFNGGYWGVS